MESNSHSNNHNTTAPSNKTKDTANKRPTNTKETQVGGAEEEEEGITEGELVSSKR
jgi:hypothetical protein